MTNKLKEYYMLLNVAPFSAFSYYNPSKCASSNFM
jgi:hypothetical protein